MLLQWKDEYSVSIEAVDCEHKQLIELINRLHDELSAKKSKLTVPAFPGDLLTGISTHLHSRSGSCAITAMTGSIAQDNHERFLDELRDIMDTFENAIAARLGLKPESLSRAFAKLRSVGVAVHAAHVR